MVDPSPPPFATYQWDTTQCYTHPYRNVGSPSCFPDGETTQSVTDNDVTAEDAGTITCTVTINGSDYTSGDGDHTSGSGDYTSGDGDCTSGNGNFTSGPFTLRISGEQLVYCVIACIVYCKQCMLLLLATCYCCIIHQLLCIEVYSL